VISGDDSDFTWVDLDESKSEFEEADVEDCWIISGEEMVEIFLQFKKTDYW